MGKREDEWDPHRAYEERKAEIEAELINHWKTPLPPNPTPRQIETAWMNDVGMIAAAHHRVRVRHAQEAVDAAAARLDALTGP